MNVIADRCAELNVPLITVGKDIRWMRLRGDLNGQAFQVTGNSGSYELIIPLVGDHQLDNASLALGALEALKQRGTKLELRHILKGLRKVRWPARLQVINKSPFVIIDGAHNVDSIKRILESVKQLCTYEHLYVVFGSSADKDIAGMARELAPFADRIVITHSSHPRAAATGMMADIFKDAGVKADVEKNVAEALANLLAIADERDLILVTGSLFLASDAQEIFPKLRKMKVMPPPTDSSCLKP